MSHSKVHSVSLSRQCGVDFVRHGVRSFLANKRVCSLRYSSLYWQLPCSLAMFLSTWHIFGHQTTAPFISRSFLSYPTLHSVFPHIERKLRAPTVTTVDSKAVRRAQREGLHFMNRGSVAVHVGCTEHRSLIQYIELNPCTASRTLLHILMDVS